MGRSGDKTWEQEEGEVEPIGQMICLGSERTTPPPFCPEYLFHLLKMEKFRSLLFTSEDDERIHMVNNFRPPQPLKGRVVKASFRA